MPAGILLGLGVGLIIGYPASGVLIGLGLGFLASAFVKPSGDSGQAQGVSCCGNGNRWISVLIGLFMIIIGVSFVWAPVHMWPYIFGIFLIVFGLWFLAKNFRKSG
jgi:hypothetical protein